MAIENINDYAGMWANGVNIGQLWDKIKEKFVSGAHDQSDATTYPASWKQQARANLGLTIGANKMWYGSAANTIGEVTTSTFGRGLLNTSSGTKVTGLFAETAEKDKNGIEISENYAHSLAITDGYLRLKNNRYVSGTASAQDLSALQLNVKLGLLQLDNTGSAGKIPLVHIPDSIMGQLTYGGTITAYTQSTDSLTVSITTGAKAILEQKTGRTIGNKTVKLVATASDPSDTSSIAYFNYTDCTGIYFIWTADALETHTGEPDYRVWPSGGPRYQAGDWLISNDTKWDKVDNTDAVTGVKGSNESAFRLGNVSIDALDVRALATYLTNTTQTVADKVQFNKDIWSLGGVAAYGISDLSAGGGGGGGLSGTIIRNWSNYQGAETEVLGANLGMRGFRMSGYSFQVNKPAVNTDNWQTEFTLGTENIPDLPLTQITGTTELRKIETLSATGTPSGFLKRASNGNWSFDTNSYALASALNDYLPLTGGTLYKSNNDVLLTFKTSSSFNTAWIGFNPANGASRYLGVDSDNNLKYQYNSQTYNVWHAGNMGAGSGLNADKLDGYEASGLFENLTNDSDQLKIQIGNTSKLLTLDYAKKTSRMRTQIKADQEFVYRQSPQTIDADSLVINKFKGRTVAWNQLVNELYLTSGTYSGLIVTNNGNGSYTFSGTTTSIFDQRIASPNVIAGHYYFVKVGIPNIDANFAQASFTLDERGCAITEVANNESRLYITIPSGVAVSGTYFPEVIDLTLLFNGNVPSGYTAADFERDFPDYLTAFNAGELRNNDAKGIESVGFNLWDEEWEVGALSSTDGSTTTSTATFRSKNFIPVDSSQYSYYLYCSSENAVLSYYYDVNYNFVGYLSGANTTNKVISMPSGARYMKIASRDYYGATYLHDICINISDPAKNGTYEPYRRIVTDLNLGDIKVKSHNIWDENMAFGYGLSGSTGEIISVSGYQATRNMIAVQPLTSYYFKSPQGASYVCFFDEKGTFLPSLSLSSLAANTSFTTPSGAYFMRMQFTGYGNTYNNDICINESSSFNGQYEPHGILTINGLKQADANTYDEIVHNKLIKRVGVLDVAADNTWQYRSNDKSFISLSAVGLIKAPASDSTVPDNIIINKVQNKYAINTFVNDDTLDSSIAIGGGGGVLIRNLAASSSVDTFKTNMSGVYLNYELATPIEYELATPIPDTMPAGTTERVISDRLPVTPFACDMTYGANPKDILASAVPFSRLQGVMLERGAFTMSTQNDSNWYLVTLGDKKLYLRFTVNTGAFKLEMASDDTENPEYSKSFEFATLSTADINAICV